MEHFNKKTGIYKKTGVFLCKVLITFLRTMITLIGWFVHYIMFFYWLAKQQDSHQGIEKKEKLVSIYLTIIAITVALNKPQLSEKMVLAIGFFLVTSIFFHMFLADYKEYRLPQLFLGLCTGTSFSYTLVFLILSDFAYSFKFLSFSFIAPLICLSLTTPYIEPIPDKVDDYELY